MHPQAVLAVISMESDSASGPAEEAVSGIAIANDGPTESRLQLRNFSEEAMDTNFHFQILPMGNQVYAWVGCNGGRLGNLYAAVPTRFEREPSVSVLLGGGADNPGASIARRLGMRAKVNVVLGSSIPANSPMLEAFAERRLLQELRAMGFIQAAPPTRPMDA